MKYLVFDTETTGLPKNWNAPLEDLDNWPRCVQLAWQLHDEAGTLLKSSNFLIYPEGFNIPYQAAQIHGISTALAKAQGKPIQEVLDIFNKDLTTTTFIVGQNLNFDLKVIGAEFLRSKINTILHQKPILDTCTEKTAALCQLPGGKNRKFKLPNLTELHQQLFKIPFAEAHNASADVEATARCFFELIRQNHFSSEELQADDNYLTFFKEKNPNPIENFGLNHVNFKELSQQYEEKPISKTQLQRQVELSEELKNANFVHLHNHSQYSVLQSTISLQALVEKTFQEGQKAVAITDLGNMMGAFAFTQTIQYHNKKYKDQPEKQIKGIIGCELSVCGDRFNKGQKDNGYAVVLLAKNKKAYHHLSILSSLAYTEGFYYVPRIDKPLLKHYAEGLICLSGGLNGELAQLILTVGQKQAENALLWYKEVFQDNFYLELMRHGEEEEEQVNAVLIEFSQKYNIPLIATNNTFYLKSEEAVAHDILLCVKEGEKKSTPIGSGRGFRYGFKNREYYFKSSLQMKQLFTDLPEAILNIEKLVDQIENYDLTSPILLPKFEIPENFLDEDDYLKYLVQKGAEKRYPNLTQDIQDRINFELSVIQKTGYPGYFLIVQDFIAKAREMGVVVGPGRGSAAGAVVAYCTGITDVDPLKYGLLFERFLNPDRVSMPDIDIDFDDEGRQKVIDYVIEKYGSAQVAQIITYGTMAAKSAIRDTARVLDLPLSEADRLTKIFPDGISLRTLLQASDSEIEETYKNNNEEKLRAQEIRKLSQEKNLLGETLQQAALLEGSLRNTGTHACGLIITPTDIKQLVPIANVKDSQMFCTQFDNAVAEYAGLLKMDFLGLRTLTILRDACQEIKKNKNIEIDINNIPLDDEKTYQLFQKGETIGIFQYESAGMQKYLKELKPTVFEDLVAMNALYRPGPLQYIPSFIRRKNGLENIEYDIPITEKYLKETYGIVVYQEQVMLLSQLLADFTKGEADALRKAMGKKQRSELDKMKPKFITQASAKGFDPKILEKIWTDWEAFASYAFNKSHSVCYAWIAYQTAYLKANFPAEYMASVLSSNMHDIKSVSFFIQECKRMKVNVLGADINESGLKFSVNRQGDIRVALGAIKGVGAAAVENLMQERAKKPFASIFDFVSRVDLRQCNKKTLEALAVAGAFDNFSEFSRASYFSLTNKNTTFIEELIKYGSKTKEGSKIKKINLFGDDFVEENPVPRITQLESWSHLHQLEREKEVLGIYLSGHPLDQWVNEMKFLCNTNTTELNQFLPALQGKTIKIGGIIFDAQHRIAKNGNGYGSFSLKDFDGEFKITLFGEDYLRFKPFVTENILIYIEGTVVNKWGREELDFKIHKMELLSEVGAKYFKTLKLEIPIQRVTPNWMTELQKTLQENQGEKQLLIHWLDEETQLIFPFMAQKKVQICPELFEGLKNLEVEFELVSS